MTYSQYTEQELGYTTQTTFWEDFSIAEFFGADAIQDTFNRAFEEWKQNIVYLTELSLVLNHKCWLWYRHKQQYSDLYKELYYKVDEYAENNLTGADLAYYERTLD